MTTQLKNSDTNIISYHVLPSPEEVIANSPCTENVTNTVYTARQTIKNILDNKDSRLFIVLGPCSIHDPKAALEYAHKLKSLADEVKDTFVLVMRVYFEKPRTSVGWKGFVNVPYLDGSHNIADGLNAARNLLVKINEIGLPVATEALDVLTPQYFDGLFSWTAIGARTTESQPHREMSSGLSAPVGFKNTTDGNIMPVVNALKSARNSHRFIGISKDGRTCYCHTSGNKYCHTVLRGGIQPTYDEQSVKQTLKTLSDNDVSTHIMIDCSHGNSSKDANNQPKVFMNCIEQIISAKKQNEKSPIASFMIESNLNFGTQIIPEDLTQLQYGVSVTDACIDWATTERIIREGREKLKGIL